MGMYTELNLGVSLQRDTPKNIIDILEYMLCGIDNTIVVKTTDHPLFQTERWDMMLVCDSFYFDGHTDSSMFRDNIDHEYKLNVRCNFKNYDNEIDLFLDFIRPYLVTTGFLGYKRYEEDDDPTLIYNNKYKDRIDYVNITR